MLSNVKKLSSALSETFVLPSSWWGPLLAESIRMVKVNASARLSVRETIPALFSHLIQIVEVAATHASRHQMLLEPGVVDALEFSDQLAPTFDGRASALAYTSWRMFEALGVAEHLREHAQRIEHILVCDGRPYGGDKPGGPGPHTLHFDRNEISEGPDGEPLGWMAENRRSRCARESRFCRGRARDCD